MTSIKEVVASAKTRVADTKESMLGVTPDNSATKVPKTTKDEKDKANNAEPNVVAEVTSARLNESLFGPRTMDKSEVVPADYYRRGSLKSQDVDGKKTQRFDFLPRTLPERSSEEPASIRLIGKTSENSRSKAVDLIPPFSRFFLESYQEGHAERHQIVETFGEFYAFFFGERPAIYTFTGTLLNTEDINWKEDFMFYYENFLRGTKCVQYQAKLLFTYNLSQIEGFLLSVSTAGQAMSEKGVQVSFQFLVTDRKNMRLSVDFGLTEKNGEFNLDESMENLLNSAAKEPETDIAEKTLDGSKPPAAAKLVSQKNTGKLKKAVKGLEPQLAGGKVEAPADFVKRLDAKFASITQGTDNGSIIQV